MAMRKIEALWRQLEDHPDLLATRSEWQSFLADNMIVAAKCLIATRERATSWACGLPGTEGCFRRVVEHSGERIVAVCPDGRCERISLTREQLVLHRLDLKRITSTLGTAVGLDADDVSSLDGDAGNRSAFRMGVRRFGIVDVAFYFSRVASADRLLPLFESIRLRDPSGPVVIFVPRTQSIELVVRDAARGKDITLMALDQHAVADDTGCLKVDLVEFVVQHRFAELDPTPFLWPRYWLVLDPREGRFWYGGRRIGFAARSRLPQIFLMELAARPGETVIRNDLCPPMWPDEYGGKKMLEVDWDRRIRDQKKKLSQNLSQAADGESSVPVDPIRAIAGTEIEGGYALDIPAARILWWSERTS